MTYIEGYIAIHRQILDSKIFASSKGFKIWIWLLLKAKFTKGFVTVTVGNGERIVELKRGQLLFGRFKAEEELNINGSTIYKWLQSFKDDKMILIESSTHYSVITIVKYNEYQELSNSKRTANEQQTNNTVTTDEQHGNNTVTHNKNDKNVEERKEREEQTTGAGETSFEERKPLNDLCFEILKYFSFTELRNPDKLRKANDFLNSLDKEKVEQFKHQFKCYQLYKSTSNEKKHSFIGFIDGGWDSENWEKKYNDFKKSQQKKPTELQVGYDHNKKTYTR